MQETVDNKRIVSISLEFLTIKIILIMFSRSEKLNSVIVLLFVTVS